MDRDFEYTNRMYDIAKKYSLKEADVEDISQQYFDFDDFEDEIPVVFVADEAKLNEGIIEGGFFSPKHLTYDDFVNEYVKDFRGKPIVIWNNISTPDTIEFEDLENLYEFFTYFDEDWEYFVAYLQHQVRDMNQESYEDFRYSFDGWHEDLTDYAQNYADGLADVDSLPAFIRDNIDWDGAGNDLEANGAIWTIQYSGGIIVLRN